MKKIFTILIVCLAIVGLRAQNAPTTMPFHFSTNTGDGAIWYHIIVDNKNGDNYEPHPWKVITDEDGETNAVRMDWGTPNSTAENQLFCFVGDNTSGFHIYCKAYLAGKTVDATTLSEDLIIQNLSIGGEPILGFTTETTITGSDLVNKFIIREGDGNPNRDGAARVERYKIQAATGTSGWRKNNGQWADLINADWGDLYCNHFQYVSGILPSEPPADGAPTNSDGFPFKLSGNTTDQAAWYNIKRHWEYGDPGAETWAWWKAPADFSGDNARLTVGWGETPTTNDADLFCFIGDAENGVSVYNKAYLTGKLGLTEDLALQNITGSSDPDWPAGGLTKNSTFSGDELFNKWFITSGTGKYGTIEYCIYVPGTDRSWHLNNGSEMEIGLNVKTWGADAFRDTFKWVEGQGATSTATSIKELNDFSNDPVVKTMYFGLDGREVYQPTSGVYIMKKIHESQKISVQKVLFQK